MQPTSSFPRRAGTAEVSVRPARPDDAPEIARVQAVTWRTAYRSILPLEVLDSWDEAAAAETWRTAVTAPPTPGHGVLVALERDTVVGFAAHGPAELPAGERPHPAGPSSEVAALLVEPRWGRRGHGSRMLAAVVDRVVPTGVRELRMWVPEEDPVTSRFLGSAGWAAGSRTRGLEADGTTIRERRWHVLLGEDGDQA